MQGYNIELGSGVYMNFGCIFLDSNDIIIGANALIGPNVQFYPPGLVLEAHPSPPSPQQTLYYCNMYQACTFSPSQVWHGRNETAKLQYSYLAASNAVASNTSPQTDLMTIRVAILCALLHPSLYPRACIMAGFW